MARQSLTFVGPLSFKAGKNRTILPYFLLFQAGQGMLELEYPDKGTAREARKTLLQADGAHPVHKNSTLKAIWEALQTPESTLSQETESGDKTPDKVR